MLTLVYQMICRFLRLITSSIISKIATNWRALARISTLSLQIVLDIMFHKMRNMLSSRDGEPLGKQPQPRSQARKKQVAGPDRRVEHAKRPGCL